jgi:hypothetical protein
MSRPAGWRYRAASPAMPLGLRSVVLCCVVARGVVVRCCVALRWVLLCCVVLCGAMLCYAVLCCAVSCCGVRCYAVLYCVVLLLAASCCAAVACCAGIAAVGWRRCSSCCVGGAVAVAVAAGVAVALAVGVARVADDAVLVGCGSVVGVAVARAVCLHCRSWPCCDMGAVAVVQPHEVRRGVHCVKTSRARFALRRPAGLLIDMIPRTVSRYRPLVRFLAVACGCQQVPPMGTWCSGTTPAQHAGWGPGFNPQRVHLFVRALAPRRAKSVIDGPVSSCRRGWSCCGMGAVAGGTASYEVRRGAHCVDASSARFALRSPASLRMDMVSRTVSRLARSFDSLLRCAAASKCPDGHVVQWCPTRSACGRPCVQSAARPFMTACVDTSSGEACYLRPCLAQRAGGIAPPVPPCRLACARLSCAALCRAVLLCGVVLQSVWFCFAVL